MKMVTCEDEMSPLTARNRLRGDFVSGSADRERGVFELFDRNVAAVALGRVSLAYCSGSRLVFPRNEQFAQRVNVSAQYSQCGISLKANFALVAATHQSVT